MQIRGRGLRDIKGNILREIISLWQGEGKSQDRELKEFKICTMCRGGDEDTVEAAEERKLNRLLKIGIRLPGMTSVKQHHIVAK